MDITNDIENPLELHKLSNVTRPKNSGRPRKSEKRIFSSPPRSIVSLILSKKPSESIAQTDTCNVNIEESLRSVRKTKQWDCRQCIFRTNDKDIFKEHMISHKNKLNACDYGNCKYTTKSSSNLIKHKRTHTGEKPYICDKCVFRTNFQNSLTVHKRIHTLERPFACRLCEYRCNSSSNLKKHCSYRHPKME